MAIKITWEYRNAIYGELLMDLGGIGDIIVDIDNADFDAARQLRRRCEENMRLLDDLGWHPDAADDEYEITMDAGDLTHALRRLNRNAGATIHQHVIEPHRERVHRPRGPRPDRLRGYLRPAVRHGRRRRALRQLHIDDAVERREAKELRHGDLGGSVRVAFPIQRIEWRLNPRQEGPR